MLSNSELTIKGPAAGLIVIAIGCVTEFGYTGGRDPAADLQAYRLALGVGVAAGVIQILFGVFRAGILGEFFPGAAVHGLLASIGVIIIAKQFPVMLGLGSEGEPLELLARDPALHRQHEPLRGADRRHQPGHHVRLRPHHEPAAEGDPGADGRAAGHRAAGDVLRLRRRRTPTRSAAANTSSARASSSTCRPTCSTPMTFPDFSGVATGIGLKYIILFAFIGSLESLLSAKAVEQIDPWQRKTNHDRDLLAVGVGNTLAALVGGLPMISEIVRSKANIDNGARTRFANMFHGVFLLLFVALVPMWIHRIPLAALAAMLVYTGFRLASPQSFVHMYHVGREQLVIFVATIVGVLATDLLVGIGIGIVVKVADSPGSRRAGPLSLLRLKAEERRSDGEVTLVVHDAAVFSTWLALRKRLVALLSRSGAWCWTCRGPTLVDHTVMDKLHELEKEFREAGSELVVDRPGSASASVSDHPAAARQAARPSPSLTGHAPRHADVVHGRPVSSTRHSTTGGLRASVIHEAAEPVANFWPM